ncbi:MAG: nitronate monooxygenase, partial [Xanthomonadaceae bacterium]|nr:nitronate monooxygenase [Xanthomonadaceae bacterium]
MVSLAQQLGIEHPLIQAPMAGASTPQMAAAVAEAGGLGSLGVGYAEPQAILEQ